MSYSLLSHTKHIMHSITVINLHFRIIESEKTTSKSTNLNATVESIQEISSDDDDFDLSSSYSKGMK